jgi:FkbM family methyltransferase
MSFISYAQNFEDVMLWRALQHVEQGFYIDVGANDPTIDSVTKAFYEAGWRGINIEPLLSHHSDLVRDRPNDINLMCAAGATVGEIELWECDVRGWATAKEEVMAQLSSVGHQGTLRRVPMRSLADICAELVKEDIHFLKIDVEGFEQEVLEGANFLRFRPWIVVIESTAPNSTIEVHNQWEHLLLKTNYQFAYADGLNRYYVALEHAELLVALRCPPNVSDNFIVFSHAKALNAAQQASEQIESLSALLKESESDRAARGEQVEYLLEQLRALFARTGFRWMTRYLNWPEIKKLAARVSATNE